MLESEAIAIHAELEGAVGPDGPPILRRLNAKVEQRGLCGELHSGDAR